MKRWALAVVLHCQLPVSAASSTFLRPMSSLLWDQAALLDVAHPADVSEVLEELNIDGPWLIVLVPRTPSPAAPCPPATSAHTRGSTSTEAGLRGGPTSRLSALRRVAATTL